jgi:predicted dehydrogenase
VLAEAGGRVEEASKVRVCVVGCGDVALRTQLPGLATVAHGAEVVALCDPDGGNAQRAAAFCAAWSPGAKTYADYREAFERADLDAVVNLTPAPLYGRVNAAALGAGLNVYTEKPMAGSVEEGRGLIAEARERGLVLMSAPAVMATSRFRWLKGLLGSGRLGRPTMIQAQMGGLGPAAWRGSPVYPRAFYGPEVGPLRDQGVYLLHGITGLLGPARRVQAMSGVAIPRRRVLSGRFEGEEFEVWAADHVLIQLDFGDATFAQVFSSYAIPASKAPGMEIHCEGGTISLSAASMLSANAPVDVYLLNDEPGEWGLRGWLEGVAPTTEPSRTGELIALGPAHFVAVLRGEEEPVLTAEHALHTLEIAEKAGRSAAEGRALDLETTFQEARS